MAGCSPLVLAFLTRANGAMGCVHVGIRQHWPLAFGPSTSSSDALLSSAGMHLNGWNNIGSVGTRNESPSHEDKFEPLVKSQNPHLRQLDEALRAARGVSALRRGLSL